MLVSLIVRDVVLVDHLHLDFRAGLSVLTGETGAGKSILLDALGLALGTRADARLLRHGAAQAVVTATFEVDADAGVGPLLSELGLGSCEQGIVLRRVLGEDGRSRAFVNDQPVGIAVLRRIGEALVEIHGQFESQRLLEASEHRRLLDAFGGLDDRLSACAEARRQWTAATEARRRADAEVATARRDEDFLRHAVEELARLDPRAGEEAALAERRAFLQSTEKLRDALADATHELSPAGGRGVDACLRAALRALQRVAAKTAGRLDAAMSALDRAAAETAEAQALLQRAEAELDIDPRALDAVEERLFGLRAVARKHDCPVDDLPVLCADMQERLQTIDDGSERLAELAAAEQAAADRYRESATALSRARQAAATRLDAAVALELEPLRLGKAQFRTAVTIADEAEWADHGWDRVIFEVATNPGQPPGPLSRIASGGELARFMLALKVVLSRADPVPTLIFDEVDAGIGGAVAAAVGDRLAKLAETVQVLVVTHSPQVAARAGHHFHIAKSVSAAGARTDVEILEGAARTEEIARMLAGARVTDEARAAAGSLLQRVPL